MKDRRAFNFYKSYYEVAKELPKKDRDEFIWSIVHAQFTGEMVDPESKLAKLMFLGQKHSIEKQIVGFQHGKNTPSKAPYKGSSKAPLPQEQEQEEGQGQGKVQEEYTIPTVEEFIKYAISVLPDVNRNDVRVKYHTWVNNGWKVINEQKGINRDIKNWKNTIARTVKYLGKEPKENIAL